jgi:hypothetical protein
MLSVVVNYKYLERGTVAPDGASVQLLPGVAELP